MKDWPTCPNCGTRVSAPVKTYSILADPDKKGVIVERQVGMYECSRCKTRFPHVFSRQELRVVKDEDLRKLEQALAEAQSVQAGYKRRIEELELEKTRMQMELGTLTERLEIAELQRKAEVFKAEVEGLKEAKRVLELEIEGYLLQASKPA